MYSKLETTNHRRLFRNNESLMESCSNNTFFFDVDCQEVAGIIHWFHYKQCLVVFVLPFLEVHVTLTLGHWKKFTQVDWFRFVNHDVWPKWSFRLGLYGRSQRWGPLVEHLLDRFAFCRVKPVVHASESSCYHHLSPLLNRCPTI